MSGDPGSSAEEQQPTADHSVLSPQSSVLHVRLGGLDLAIEATRARRAAPVEPITPLPRAPRGLLGVVNLLGEVVPVVDLRILLGLPPAARPERMRLLVVEWGDEDVALLVDAVGGVFHLPSEGFEPASSFGGIDPTLLVGVARVDERPIGILDLEKLLDGVDTPHPPAPSPTRGEGE